MREFGSLIGFLTAPSHLTGRVVVSQKVHRSVSREIGFRVVTALQFRRSLSVGRPTIVRSVASSPGALRLSRGRWGRSSRRQMALNHSWARNKAREINNHLCISQLELRRGQSLDRGFRKARPTSRREAHSGRVPIAIFLGGFPFKLRRGPPAAGGDLPAVFAVNVQHAEWVA